LDEVLQPKPASNRGTKRDSSHLSTTKEHLILGPIVVDLGDDDDVFVDEFIINSSLALLVLENSPSPQAFRDVVSFIEKVMHLEPLMGENTLHPLYFLPKEKYKKILILYFFLEKI
jgi:hypothetical protein